MGLFDWFGESETLYFPGCMGFSKHRDKVELYQRVFSKLGIGVKILDEPICCGLEVYEAGYDAEARKIARRNFQNFIIGGINRVITTSPECYKMFLINYPDFLFDWNIEVENTWGLIVERLKKKHRLIKHKAMEIVGYHDSCYLGRYCKIYDEPREILELIGYEIKEMDNFRENSFCCGSCGGLARANPELALKIAQERVLQAKRVGINKIIVCGFENYDLLKKGSKDTGVEVFELSEVLGQALGIEIIQKEVEEEIEGEENILESAENFEKTGESKSSAENFDAISSGNVNHSKFSKESDEEDVLTETKANMRLREELKDEDFEEFDDDKL